MRLVMTAPIRDDADIIDAQIAYHLGAGVDHVVVGDLGFRDATREIVGTFADDEVTVVGPAGAQELRDTMRRAAVGQGAEWIIESDPDEFWWPRGASLKDVLEPIPPRYTTVQALVRVFLPRPGEGSFLERMTVRTTLLDPGAEPEPAERALRPVLRVRGGGVVDATDGRNVPLRAWYPIEVLRFPLRAPEQATSFSSSGGPRSRLEAAFLDGDRRDPTTRYADLVIDDERLRAGLDAGSLVEDVRLRDHLRALRRHGNATLEPTPTIVDEAMYAIECAAVGEVDLAGLDRHIRELERRISLLEQRLWPRVVRRLSRIVTRSGS